MPLTIAALTIAMGMLKADGLEPPRLFMGRLPSMILPFGHGLMASGGSGSPLAHFCFC